MISVDPATGNIQWSVQLPNETAFSSAPTAFGGKVYVGGAGVGGVMYAVNETDGQVVWTNWSGDGDESSPVVTSDGVYVSYAVNQAYAFDPTTGTLLWHSGPIGSGDGGRTVALLEGVLYSRDIRGNLILDPFTGESLGTYQAGPIPAGSRA